MRIALLSALKHGDDPDAPLRAHLRLAGRKVLVWQIDLALRLGCEKVICLSHRNDADILAAQQHAEGLGLGFHTIRGPLQLVSLITADHELVMMQDGLVIDPDYAQELSGAGKGISALPASIVKSTPDLTVDDFERIDAQRCWAGFALLRGNIVSKLADLPPDSDTMSLLLRLGLQSGAPVRMLGENRRSTNSWLLATSSAKLAERETALIGAAAQNVPWSAPFEKLAGYIAQQIAPGGADYTGGLVAGAGVVILLCSAALAIFDYAFGALVSACLGAFCLSTGAAISSLKAALFGRPYRVKISQGLNALRDIVVIVCAAFPYVAYTSVVAAILAVGLMRVASRTPKLVQARFWEDRTAHLFLLSIAAGVGELPVAVSAFSLVALLSVMLQSREEAS